MPEDIEAIKHAKYLAEQYPFTIDFSSRLRTGQTVTGLTAVATDVNGNDVTSTLCGTTTVSSPMASVLLKANGGAVGQLYDLKLIAQCTADILEQLVVLEIR